MRTETNPKRYIFEATAVGVAGKITHPFHEIIPVQGASALPPDGGFGSSRVEGFRHREILSFGSSYTEVVGAEEGSVFDTLALSVVEKFNLLDVVTCDRIVSRLTGRFSLKDSVFSVVPTGSRFERLRVGNLFFERLEVAPKYFCEDGRDCWPGLLRAAEDTANGVLSSLVLPDANGKPIGLPRPGQGTGVLGFCIAAGEPRPKEELPFPIPIVVPHFGTVHLGEFICYPNSRSLTMIRVELGCSVGGQASANTSQIVRGGPYPP